ncbi:MAG: class I SAM-dependent methyltransferase, partial [Acidimicrobiales bacterium]
MRAGSQMSLMSSQDPSEPRRSSPDGRQKPLVDFGRYFEHRASRFAAFYRSEPFSRAIGRGALFDRLRNTVDLLVEMGARRVLDVGCGSGPLFAPLVERGVTVTGIDPAPAMVALAREAAEHHSGQVKVEQRRWEEIDEVDAFDAAVALGVFDYVGEPADLLALMARAAPRVIGSFPSPGLRLILRKLRYGAHGVSVSGYTPDRLRELAE